MKLDLIKKEIKKNLEVFFFYFLPVLSIAWISVLMVIEFINYIK